MSRAVRIIVVVTLISAALVFLAAANRQQCKQEPGINCNASPWG